MGVGGCGCREDLGADPVKGFLSVRTETLSWVLCTGFPVNRS